MSKRGIGFLPPTSNESNKQRVVGRQLPGYHASSTKRSRCAYSRGRYGLTQRSPPERNSLMDFSFSEEQEQLRSSLQAFLQAEYTFAARRAATRSSPGLRREVWSAFAD